MRSKTLKLRPSTNWLMLMPVVLLLAWLCSRGGILFFAPYDLKVYFDSSRWVMGSGRLYRDVLSEYPLPANLIFALIRSLSRGFLGFTALWAMTAAACLCFGARIAVRDWAAPEAKWILLSPALVYFTICRYDIYPALATFACLLSIQKGKWNRASIFLGLSIALKGYAFFLLPSYYVF